MSITLLCVLKKGGGILVVYEYIRNGLFLLLSIFICIESFVQGFEKRAVHYYAYITKVLLFTFMANIYFISILDILISELIKSDIMMIIIIILSNILTFSFALIWYWKRKVFDVYGIKDYQLECLILIYLTECGISHSLSKNTCQDSYIYFTGTNIFIKIKEKSTSSRYRAKLIFVNSNKLENSKEMMKAIFSKIEKSADENDKIRGLSNVVALGVLLVVIITIYYVKR